MPWNGRPAGIKRPAMRVADNVTVTDARRELDQATALIRAGDYAAGRDGLIAILKKDPGNLDAWNWAYQVAIDKAERQQCLEQIVTLNPADREAKRRLAELVGAPRAVEPAAKDKARRKLTPTSCLAVVSQLFIVLVVVAIVAGLIYTLPRSSLFGLRGPDFDSLQISDSFDSLESDDFVWQIVFERPDDSVFEGTVRHNSAIRLNRFRILTHDVLVTTGDYADPQVVNTSVSNHHFRWSSNSDSLPDGTIHLLHTVPADQAIYEQLSAIAEGDRVKIDGQEILRIKVFDLDGNYLGEWHDEGCNTILVRSLQVERD